MYTIPNPPKKASGKMTYAYEQCTNKDKIHTDVLVYKDGAASHWLCVECGRRAGIMRVN